MRLRRDTFDLELMDIRRPKAEMVADLLALEYPDARADLDFRDAFELLVATVLSAQTTDVRVNQVTPELFDRWPTPTRMAEAQVEQVEEVVRPLGMFRRRAKALVDLSDRLVDEYDGEVPGQRKDLVTLPGVGRKTANVVLGNWFGAEEISVDTHVARVTGRLGWTDSKNPVVIERELWALLPDANWTQLSHELIYHGRRICHARKPLCGQCVLAELCPSAGLFD